MKKILLLVGVFLLLALPVLQGQTAMANVKGRKTISLNGPWKAIIDINDVGIGDWTAIWKDKTAKGKSDFVEYSFDHGPVLMVPGDFNTQLPELAYYESSVWYKRNFNYHKSGHRLFIHFGAVNYACDVVLNGEKIGHHEGGFTPFQFEITGQVKEGDNAVLVRANNKRTREGVPALGFDWFNYGGITRDVQLIETAPVFIEDYFIQLQKGSMEQVLGWVKLNNAQASTPVTVTIPELGFSQTYRTSDSGLVPILFAAKFRLWSPQQPKRYKIIISTASDTLVDNIGFRSIEVKGTDILLNGKPVFLKGVNYHEEAPQRGARAYSETDALTMLTRAKALGCNFVRMAHYPHNENEMRLADELGLMVWEELPVYQGIAFGDTSMQAKMNYMLREMIQRDRNHCSVIVWSMSNETSPGKDRDATLIKMAQLCRTLDPARLVSSALDKVDFRDTVAVITDTLVKALDIIAVNQYLGWYRPWPSSAGKMQWKSDFNKPLLFSEFGAEALQGNHGSADTASKWTEEFQEQVYKDQVAMFKTIPFLKGICPWILVDFRSPVRMHPVYQKGWNRKGLLGNNGQKKKAWYIIKNFYETVK
jgi:beta-glucuronidase